MSACAKLGSKRKPPPLNPHPGAVLGIVQAGGWLAQAGGDERACPRPVAFFQH